MYNLDYEPKAILFSGTLFELACKKLAVRKPFLSLLNRKKILLSL